MSRPPAPANFIANLTPFPPIVDGRMEIRQFLQASADLVSVIERISKAFTPVKYDMLGNIEKIKKSYELKKDNVSCILELVECELKAGENIATEGLLWLNRAMLFIELVFHQIVGCLENNDNNTSMKKILNVAYEGSVKRYHNWVSRQLFALICNICPTLPQMSKSLNAESDLKAFQTDLQTLNVSLHLARSKIDDFFNDRNMYQDK